MLDALKNDFSVIFKKDFIEQRYHLHLIGGVLLGVLFWFATVEAHYDYARIMLSILIVLFCAVGWEMVRGLLYAYPLDWADVRFSVYGGVIGCVTACLL